MTVLGLPSHMNLLSLTSGRIEMKRRTFCQGTIATLVALPLPALAAPIRATLFKNPQCDCCDIYAAYLRENGFEVDVRLTNDLAEINSKAGFPEKIQGCHAMFVDGYVVDGLVPVNIVRKLLSERPAIPGITLPGMPRGAPGMPGQKIAPFTIYAVTKDGAPPTVYAVE
jgi:hypothetical protein